MDFRVVEKIAELYYNLTMNDEKETSIEVANQMSWSKEELDAHDARGIYIQDERGRIEYALEEGMKIGKRGREVDIARELKKNGVNIDIIVASTGLTKAEIEKL
jgi:predicted transposase/invertase (TIGR01784 family)